VISDRSSFCLDHSAISSLRPPGQSFTMNAEFVPGNSLWYIVPIITDHKGSSYR